MDNQKNTSTGKRSYVIPILLLLLVFSVTSNVLLYTKNIRHNQETLESKGIEIFQTVVSSRDHTNEMAQFLTDLLEEQDAAKARGKAASAASFIIADHTLINLLQYAEETPIEEYDLKGAKQQAVQFVTQVATYMQEIGDQTGAISEDEQQKLLQLREKYEQLHDELTGFPYSIEGYMTSMIRLANGYELNPVAAKLTEVLKNE